jgi:hypothetical protein
MPDRPKSTPPEAPGGTRTRVSLAESEAQFELMKAVGKLAVLRARLWSQHKRHGERPEDDEMHENRAPDSVRVSVRGAIECACIDGLDGAIASLDKAARDTPESLAVEWRERVAEQKRLQGEKP